MAQRLGTPGLVIFGLVLVQPIAPVPLFGLASNMTKGHATLALVCAMIAMSLTAISYGRMAAAHPTGGSAYTYAARELHPRIGFLAGWAMGLDYLLIPVISALYASLTLTKLFPWLPVPLALVCFIASLTAINLAGQQVYFKANVVLLVLMLGAVIVFFAATFLFVSQTRGWNVFIAPSSFYNPSTFDSVSLWRGTALVALTYLGFDGVTTLADEARDAAVNVPRATILVVLITGVLGSLQVHFAHVAWPAFATFPAPETAFLDVAMRVGGRFVLGLISVTLIVASAGTFLSAQAGASRLLLAMGKDGALPKRPFAIYSGRRGVPSVNVILVGVLAGVGAVALRFEQAAELVNFGALVAFVAVNAAAVKRTFVRRQVWATTLGTLALGFCCAIAAGLSPAARVIGVAWLSLGAAFTFCSTRGQGALPCRYPQ
ncbi:MAG: APC family permease [Deltaproteobacteria bacterium]|nr:APC family permease [Deltaproteobacteria bacterium]